MESNSRLRNGIGCAYKALEKCEEALKGQSQLSKALSDLAFAEDIIDEETKKNPGLVQAAASFLDKADRLVLYGIGYKSIRLVGSALKTLECAVDSSEEGKNCGSVIK